MGGYLLCEEAAPAAFPFTSLEEPVRTDPSRPEQPTSEMVGPSTSLRELVEPASLAHAWQDILTRLSHSEGGRLVVWQRPEATWVSLAPQPSALVPGGQAGRLGFWDVRLPWTSLRPPPPPSFPRVVGPDFGPLVLMNGAVDGVPSDATARTLWLAALLPRVEGQLVLWSRSTSFRFRELFDALRHNQYQNLSLLNNLALRMDKESLWHNPIELYEGLHHDVPQNTHVWLHIPSDCPPDRCYPRGNQYEDLVRSASRITLSLVWPEGRLPCPWWLTTPGKLMMTFGSAGAHIVLLCRATRASPVASLLENMWERFSLRRLTVCYQPPPGEW